jgi:hypothetical protein
MKTMTKNAAATRRLPLVSYEQLNSLACQGFAGFAASDFVSTNQQAVIGSIGTWRGTASQGSYAPVMFTPVMFKPTMFAPIAHVDGQQVTSTHALIETSAADLAAAKRTRTFGLAKAAKDADRGVEGIARRGVPV